MGLFGKDEAKSTSSSTTSADPQYTQGYSNLYSQAQTVAGKPYDPAADKTIAGFTGPQQQAFGQVQSNLGNYQPFMNQAANLTGQGSQAITGADISNYMNPYQQQVIDATQQQFNTQNARADQQLAGNTARAAMTGNTGRDVAQALQSEAQMNAQNPVIAGMYQQGYQNAQSAAQADKARMLQGGSQYGALGGLQQNYANTDVGALLGIGNQQQQQQQNVNDAASANAAAKNQYGMDALSWLAKMTQGGAGMSQTQTGTQTQDMGGSSLGQILGTGLSLFSMLKDGGRVNGYAEGGAVGYQPKSYVPGIEGLSSGVQGAGQAPSIGSQTGGQNGMDQVLGSYKQAKDALGGMGNLFQKANTTTDANGWSTTSQPSGAGWSNWLGNGGLGGMFGFAEGGRVEDDAGLGSIVSNLEALDSPVMGAGTPRPLVAPTETGSIAPVPQSAPAEAPKGNSGLFGLGLSDAARQGLLTAGLGMMASRSRVPAMALGQGGLQGVQAYQEALQAEKQEAHRKQQMEQQANELRQRQLEAQQRFSQQAQAFPMEQRLRAAQAAKAERELSSPQGELRTVGDRLVRIGPDNSVTELVGSGKSDADARIAEAVKLGYDPKSEAVRQYALTGVFPKENQQRITAIDKKFIEEADQMVMANKSVVDAMQKAKAVSSAANSGPLASARGWLGANLPDSAVPDFLSTSGSGMATMELDNQVVGNALSQLKTIFGGNPTEGERKILLDLQGSSSMPKEVRDRLYDTAARRAQRYAEFNEVKAAAMRSGEYYKPDFVMPIPDPKKDDSDIEAGYNGTAPPLAGSKPSGATGSWKVEEVKP